MVASPRGFWEDSVQDFGHFTLVKQLTIGGTDCKKR